MHITRTQFLFYVYDRIRNCFWVVNFVCGEKAGVFPRCSTTNRQHSTARFSPEHERQRKTQSIIL